MEIDHLVTDGTTLNQGNFMTEIKSRFLPRILLGRF